MKKDKLLLVSLGLSVVYVVGTIVYYFVSMWTNPKEHMMLNYLSIILIPHFIGVLVGIVMSYLAYEKFSRRFVIYALFGYIVAILLFPYFYFYVTLQLILCLVVLVKNNNALFR